LNETTLPSTQFSKIPSFAKDSDLKCKKHIKNRHVKCGSTEDLLTLSTTSTKGVQKNSKFENSSEKNVETIKSWKLDDEQNLKEEENFSFHIDPEFSQENISKELNVLNFGNGNEIFQLKNQDLGTILSNSFNEEISKQNTSSCQFDLPPNPVELGLNGMSKSVHESSTSFMCVKHDNVLYDDKNFKIELLVKKEEPVDPTFDKWLQGEKIDEKGEKEIEIVSEKINVPNQRFIYPKGNFMTQLVNPR